MALFGRKKENINEQNNVTPAQTVDEPKVEQFVFAHNPSYGFQFASVNDKNNPNFTDVSTILERVAFGFRNDSGKRNTTDREDPYIDGGEFYLPKEGAEPIKKEDYFVTNQDGKKIKKKAIQVNGEYYREEDLNTFSKKIEVLFDNTDAQEGIFTQVMRASAHNSNGHQISPAKIVAFHSEEYGGKLIIAGIVSTPGFDARTSRGGNSAAYLTHYYVFPAETKLEDIDLSKLNFMSTIPNEFRHDLHSKDGYIEIKNDHFQEFPRLKSLNVKDFKKGSKVKPINRVDKNVGSNKTYKEFFEEDSYMQFLKAHGLQDRTIVENEQNPNNRQPEEQHLDPKDLNDAKMYAEYYNQEFEKFKKENNGAENELLVRFYNKEKEKENFSLKHNSAMTFHEIKGNGEYLDIFKNIQAQTEIRINAFAYAKFYSKDYETFREENGLSDNADTVARFFINERELGKDNRIFAKKLSNVMAYVAALGKDYNAPLLKQNVEAYATYYKDQFEKFKENNSFENEDDAVARFFVNERELGKDNGIFAKKLSNVMTYVAALGKDHDAPLVKQNAETYATYYKDQFEKFKENIYFENEDDAVARFFASERENIEYFRPKAMASGIGQINYKNYVSRFKEDYENFKKDPKNTYLSTLSETDQFKEFINAERKKYSPEEFTSRIIDSINYVKELERQPSERASAPENDHIAVSPDPQPVESADPVAPQTAEPVETTTQPETTADEPAPNPQPVASPDPQPTSQPAETVEPEITADEPAPESQPDASSDPVAPQPAEPKPQSVGLDGPDPVYGTYGGVGAAGNGSYGDESTSNNAKKKFIFENFTNEAIFFYQHYSEETHSIQENITETETVNSIDMDETTRKLFKHFLDQYILNNRERFANDYNIVVEDNKIFVKNDKGEKVPITDEQKLNIFQQEAEKDPEQLVIDFKVAMKDQVPITSNIVLPTGNLRSLKRSNKANDFGYVLDGVEKVGVGIPISLGKGREPQQIIATNDETNLISVIQDGKVLANFVETEDNKIKLIFTDTDEGKALKQKFIEFYSKNKDLEIPFTESSDGIILENVTVDSRLDLRVGGANTDIGFLFSAFGLQIADKDHNSVVHRNENNSPFSFAYSNKFIENALKGLHGCSIAKTNSTAMETLLIGQMLLLAKNKSETIKEQTFTYGENAQESYKLTSITTEIFKRDKSGTGIEKDKENKPAGTENVELKFLEKDDGKGRKTIQFHCSLSVPDSKAIGKNTNRQTAFYDVLDIEIYDSAKKDDSPYNVENMPEGRFIRIMLQDPKDKNKTYAVIYPITEKNAELIERVGQMQKELGENTATKNLRAAQKGKDGKRSNEQIALARTYSENEVAALSRSEQDVSMAINDGKQNVYILNASNAKNITNIYNNFNYKIVNGTTVVYDRTTLINIIESDGDGGSGVIQDPLPQPQPPDDVIEEPENQGGGDLPTFPEPPQENLEDRVKHADELAPSGLDKLKPDVEKGPDSVFKNPNVYASLGLIFAILSVFMPFLLPLSYVSFGAALTKPWDWPYKFNQMLRDASNRAIIKQNDKTLKHNLSKEQFNALSKTYNKTVDTLKSYKSSIDNTLTSLENGTGKRLTEDRRKELQEQKVKLENANKDNAKKIETLKSNEQEMLKAQEAVANAEQKFEVDNNKLQEDYKVLRQTELDINQTKRVIDILKKKKNKTPEEKATLDSNNKKLAELEAVYLEASKTVEEQKKFVDKSNEELEKSRKALVEVQKRLNFNNAEEIKIAYEGLTAESTNNGTAIAQIEHELGFDDILANIEKLSTEELEEYKKLITTERDCLENGLNTAESIYAIIEQQKNRLTGKKLKKNNKTKNVVAKNAKKKQLKKANAETKKVDDYLSSQDVKDVLEEMQILKDIQALVPEDESAISETANKLQEIIDKVHGDIASATVEEERELEEIKKAKKVKELLALDEQLRARDLAEEERKQKEADRDKQLKELTKEEREKYKRAQQLQKQLERKQKRIQRLTLLERLARKRKEALNENSSQATTSSVAPSNDRDAAR